jgi:hypothetical protein
MSTTARGTSTTDHSAAAPGNDVPSTGARARAGLPRPVRLTLDAAGWTVGAGFAVAAAARGGKAVHPHGAVHAAEVEIFGNPDAPPALLLRRAATHSALARFSRSLGLPRPLPDLLGLSLRIADVAGPGQHQDFLLVTSLDAPVLHHAFLPARDVWSRPYTSALLYRAGAERFLVGARPLPGARPGGDHELDRLGAAAATGTLRFELCVAPPWGRFHPVGQVRIGGRLPQELDATHFSVWNSPGGLRPAGVLNRLRDYAYPMSQRAWDGRR